MMMTRTRSTLVPIFLQFVSLNKIATAWLTSAPKINPDSTVKDYSVLDGKKQPSRRDALFFGVLVPAAMMVPLTLLPAHAYTPDPDPLRESLYLMSRVQEATVQQERFVNKSSMQEDLKNKMKLTLKLVEKNYRLLDQINYASTFVEPKDEIVTATEAGYEAADALQGAIDFVKNDLGVGQLTDSQKTFLATSMKSCRDNLFIFLKYMPQDKLEAARKRVEEENVLNMEEFDGEADAGVYSPVVLPWKQKR